MRVVVTGAAGFAARHLIDHLLAMRDQVLGVVKSAVEGDTFSQHHMGRVAWTPWDVRNEPSRATIECLEAFRPDALLHLAAISIPDYCGDQEPTRECRAVNIDGAARVADWCRKVHIPRLLFVSSAQVYGRSRNEYWRVAEDGPLQPHTGYGKSKLEAEQRITEVLAGSSTELVIVRAFNHSGPGQLGPLLMPEWAEQFADPDITTLRVRSLRSHVDLSDVRDVVRAYRMIVATASLTGPVNVGSGKATSTSDLFELFCRVTGRRPQVQEETEQARWGPVADLTRLVDVTGWHADLPLEKTVQDTIEFFRSCRS